MTPDSCWQPQAELAALRERAGLLAYIRQFFAEREVLEVETPLCGHYTVTDPHIDALRTEQGLFLQTSPEYAMKRLLAADSGAIYQICKAFRRGDRGSRHNPEFSMLEWYRPGFDERDLMDEVQALLAPWLGVAGFDRHSYREVFEQVLAIDPHSAPVRELERIARQHLDIQMNSDNRDDWLGLLLAELIEPALGPQRPCFLYDYPASQAALAQVRTDQRGQVVARRFELYYRGVELANGYCELTDAGEQLRRFAADNALRLQLGKEPREGDPRLLAALQAGLPDCAGVAMGLDRLLMLRMDATRIDQVLSFALERA